MSKRKPKAQAHVSQPVVLSLIDPPQFNPREVFPDDEIRHLADSIDSVGLLHPVILRPVILRSGEERFELVAGECRFRAVAMLGWKSITAIVRELDDRECAEIRLLENLDRNSLNPAEESRALGVLRELGHDAESLAALLGLTADDVETRLKLAELPAFWQAWLREERDARRGAAAERLVEWLDFPHVLEVMQRVIEGSRWPMPLSYWKREITDVVLRLSRDLDPGSPCGPLFDVCDEALIERLQPVELRIGGETAQRAMNADLWDQLQDAASRPAEAVSNGHANGHAEPESPVDEGPADADYLQRLARWKDRWLRDLIAQRITAMDLNELESLAEALGVDVAESWETVRPFLELHNGEQLRELAKAWNVDVSQCRDRGEAIAVLLHTRRQHTAPDVVRNVASMVDVAAL